MESIIKISNKRSDEEDPNLEEKGFTSKYTQNQQKDADNDQFNTIWVCPDNKPYQE